jgi:predicted GNAT superfamily acetyltransferase
VEIRLATTDDEVDALLALATSVWGAPPVSVPIARASALAGWYCTGAWDGDDPIGMCAGFVGVHDDHLHLHSHLAAVDPSARGQGIGRALKRHQREWCLAHDIPVVSWTFDPLVRENARFNLHHLGAVGERYLVDLYGPMDDDINRGQPSDRLLIQWDLRSDRVLGALDGPLPVPDADDAERIATPDDITALRRTDPAAALRWRHEVREAMLDAFARGLRPVALDADDAYVLAPADPEPA